MTIRRVFAVVVALVLIPFTASWGALLLIPAALLLVPCVLLAVIAAAPALLVAMTHTAGHGGHRPQAPISGKPVYTA